MGRLQHPTVSTTFILLLLKAGYTVRKIASVYERILCLFQPIGSYTPVKWYDGRIEFLVKIN